MPLDSMQARANVLRSWAATTDRAARTAPGRRALDERFVTQARELLGADASEHQVTQSADALRRAHFILLARKSAAARRRK